MVKKLGGIESRFTSTSNCVAWIGVNAFASESKWKPFSCTYFSLSEYMTSQCGTNKSSTNRDAKSNGCSKWYCYILRCHIFLRKYTKPNQYYFDLTKFIFWKKWIFTFSSLVSLTILQKKCACKITPKKSTICR